MNANRSVRAPSDPSLSSTFKDEEETGTDNADSIAEKFIHKSREILVQCMDPNPVFDCALKSDFFAFHQITDMKVNISTN